MTSWKLSDEQISQVIKFTKIAAEHALVARKAIAITTVPQGTMAGKYKTMNDSNETTTLYTPGSPDSQVSSVEFDWNSFKLWQNQRHYDMSDWFQAGDKDGEFSDEVLARTIRYMALFEDKMIVDGWTNSAGTYVNGATGFVGTATNTHAAGATWITTGDIYSDILKALTVMAQYGIPTENRQNIYVMCYPDRREAFHNLDTNDVPIMKSIIEGLRIPEANILPTASITSSQAVVVYKDPLYAQLAVGEDMDVKPPYDMGAGQYRFFIRHISGLKIKETNSVYKITGV